MKKAQSLLEYSILIMIIIAAIVVMQVYIKRGFQGRWKQAVDDLGEQYDAQGYTSNTRYVLNTVSESAVRVEKTTAGGVNGSETFRSDSSTTVEKKTGSTALIPMGL